MIAVMCLEGEMSRGQRFWVVRMVDDWVDSVTGVHSGLVMAVVEVMVADTHTDGVRVDERDLVMEEVVQLMMQGGGHYRGGRGRGEMAVDEEIVHMLDSGGGLGGGHTVSGERDHGVGERVRDERLAGQQ